MKSGSYILCFYILAMLIFPLQFDAGCDHHDQWDYANHDTNEEPDHTCPPFSFCKHCSYFIFHFNPVTLFHAFEPKLGSPVADLIFSKALGYSIDFWHPPKTA